MRITVTLTAPLVVMVLCSCPLWTKAATQEDYYDLLDYIFDDYRKEVRPIIDDSNATEVDISFWLLSIVDLDEKNQVLSTAVMIQVLWTDEWMVWDPNDYGGITGMRYPQDDLWLPDIIVSNSVKSQTQLGYKESPCRINQYGDVEWRPSEILETSCDMDVTYYPFDEQECSVILSTWASPISEIVLLFDSSYEDINLNKYSPSGTWEIVSTSLVTLPDADNLSRIQYNIKLRRLSTYYVLNIMVPILLLSLTASAVFYLPAESGEKIGMSMTVLLAFAVYLTIISENMPQTSLQVSILSVYLAILLAICGLSVFMSVFVLHLHHSPPTQPVGPWMLAFTRILRKFVCTGHKHAVPCDEEDGSTHNVSGGQARRTKSLLDPLDKCTPDSPNARFNRRTGKVTPLEDANGNLDQHNNAYVSENNTPYDGDEEHITWPVVAETVDNVFFLAVSISIVALTAGVMGVLIGGSPS